MWARSYRVRALVAVSFLVGFYALALGIASGLLWLAWVDATVGRRVHPKLIILCAIGAGTILFSIIPRRNPWEAPGPRIREADQPRLFALIKDVARQMGAQMPDEVYLIPDVNAFVTQRGGFLGFGSTRVMGIGVPLLAVDNVSQLRATIAHEFGHFAGGETRLLGLVYTTRSAMIRTLQNLTSGGSSVLHLPFEWMANTYMRLTLAISRQQELIADEWSVRIAGKEAHISGLKAEALHGVGFGLFMREEVAPLSSLGVTPDNMFEGYRRFMRSSGWEQAQPRISQGLQEASSDPYDSHPALAERVAFAEKMEAPAVELDTTPAYTLLENVEALEAEFSQSLRAPGDQVVAWDALGPAWGKMWAGMAERAAARVPEFSVDQIVVLAQDRRAREQFVETVQPRLVGYLAEDRDEQVDALARRYAAAYLGTLLSGAGWKWTTSPGEPLRLVQDERLLDPNKLMEALFQGKLTPEEFREQSGAASLAPLAISDAVRERMVARGAPVTVTVEKNHAVVVAPLDRLFFPHCCALCCGLAEYEAGHPFKIEGFLSGDETLTLEFCMCEQHKHDAAQPFRIKKFDKDTTEITLVVPNEAYARLMERCNA